MTLRPSAYGLSDVGRKREQNEDSHLIDPALGLYVVADGMGGHAAGEVASGMAVRKVRDHVAAHAAPFVQLAADGSQENRLEAQAAVARAIQSACAEIFAVARAEPQRRGMGTTCDAVVVAGGFAVIGHVGDSRVYLLRQGRAHRLTEDHTLVALQVKAGLLSREEAAASGWRSVLVHAVGVQESVPVDTLLVECLPGDLLLLCSDGLHGHVADEEFSGLLAEGAPAEYPRRLVDLANERGGQDNITAIVVAFAPPGGEPTPADAGAMMDILQKIPLFAGLTYKESAGVLAIATAHRYGEGQVIVREGAPGESIYIVVRGRLAVEKAGIQITELGPGGHFGEMSLVDNAPRSATVRVLEAARVIVVSRTSLMSLLRREPRLAVKLLWSFVLTLSERLRTANHEIVEARQELAVARSDGPFIVVED